MVVSSGAQSRMDGACILVRVRRLNEHWIFDASEPSGAINVNANGKPSSDFVVKPRPDLSQQLSQQIVELIAAHEMQPGDRLPTMKALAQRFAVATPTIREALRRLQATGVIDIRHGSGIYVLRPDQGMMIANPHYGQLDAKSILDLLDSRLLIEPYLAGIAAERATPAAIAELEAVLAEAEQLLEGQDASLGTTNMRFHTAIARASDNRILAHMLESIVEVYDSEQFAILELFNARVSDHQDHLGILEAIRDHDAARASKRMTKHISRVRAVIAKRLQEEPVSGHDAAR